MFIEADWSPSADDMDIIRQGLIVYNRVHHPALNDLEKREFAVIARDDSGVMIGGAVGEIDWGWLYLDTLWVAEAARGQGVGARLLNRFEQVGVAHGITCAHLITNTFQADGFYRKQGYRELGRNRNRPAGYDVVHFTRTGITARPFDQILEVKFSPTTADTLLFERGLFAHAEPIAPIVMRRLALWLKDESGRIRGGVTGLIFWDWYDMHLVWIDPTLHGQGWGSRLMQRLDDVLISAGVTGIAADTAEWQALGFYQKHGFTVLGRLDDKPPGSYTTYIQKVLKTS